MVKLVATLSSYGSRAVVVGGVADRYAGELARAGQSNRRRAGTGSASPQRATRPPLWPAGMAARNRETFGPRVGLSSHGSPAKGGPKSKCLARVKIARTSAGPPSLTISDPSRFPFSNIGPVPLPASRSAETAVEKVEIDETGDNHQAEQEQQQAEQGVAKLHGHHAFSSCWQSVA